MSQRFFIVMYAKTPEISVEIEAKTHEEAQELARQAYPRYEIKMIEQFVTCPWCSGEGCSVYNVARGGCKDGQVPKSQAQAMRSEC